MKGPGINVKEALYGSEAVGGVLGAALGESPSETTARIEEAKKGATDLTGLVKRKKALKAATPEPNAAVNDANGKRKAEDDVAESSEPKKAKVDTVPADSDAK